jgi:hypothetical protein
MRIPVVLSTVHVEIGADGDLSVDISGVPYAVDRRLGRAELRTVLDEITTDLGTAVRVKIRESDGTTYADIATPPEEPRDRDAPEPAEQVPVSGLAARGFQPGEEVAIAYVVARKIADGSGRTAVRLPPALASARRQGFVLLGMTSQVIAAIEQPS